MTGPATRAAKPPDDDPATLYDHAPCGYLSTTADGTISRVNETFLTMTGYGRDDLVEVRTFADLLSPGGRIYHETHYAPLLQMQDEVNEIAFEIVCADGGRLPVLVNSVLVRDATGAPSFTRTAVFDATERRHYERELLRAKQRAEESEAQASLLAQTLQRTLIPPAPPDVPGLDIAAVYRPAGTGTEVGGDFYDVFPVADGDWVVVVGDVCGKGVDAAIITASARYAIRHAVVQHPKPRDSLAALNRALLDHDTDRFCTVSLVRLRQRGDRWTATVSSGGHPPAVHGRDGRSERVGRPGSLIGIFDSVTFEDVDLELLSGDVLIFYTDGVTEGRRGDELFGDGPLRTAAAAGTSSAEALIARMLEDVLQFQSGTPRDDIVVVVVRVP